jgi:citrate synthase
MNEKIYRGLDGVCIDTTSLSKVDGQNGNLIYLGYNIDELVNCNFEEITYLFLYKKLPNKKELEELDIKIKKNRTISTDILQYIENNSQKDHPMATLRTCVSMLSANSNESMERENYLNTAISLISKTSLICAAICRKRMKKKIILPNKELGFTANFLYMIFGENVDNNVIKTLDLAFILHIDHSFNASTFTARVVASTLSDLISSVTAAIGSLKGPLHGGANAAVMKMLKEINNIDNVDSWLNNALLEKRKIMGFGHRVYKVFDPRATHLKKMSHKWGSLSNNMKWFDISNKLEKLMYDKKKINPNVDFYSASTYYSMGIDPDNYTMLFAVARVVGWIAHVQEQLANNRIIRPKAKYIGELNKKYLEI